MDFKIGDGDVVTDSDSNPIVGEPRTGQRGICKGYPCTYYIGWGWMTLEELSELRSREPRIAP